tara:strand:+ start:314 stop:556 length:243 start_codon:yes stop_codon:yes gene_type:complete
MEKKISINFDDFDDKILKSSIVRLSYLYPTINFILDGKTIIADKITNDEDNIKKEINYSVYREKIYEENKEIRKKIFEEI